MKNLKTFLFSLIYFIGLTSHSLQAQSLYVQLGTDVPFQQLIDQKILPVGFDSDIGVKGSTIDVNNNLVEQGPYANNDIEQAIGIHTVANSNVIRRDFSRWTRWYQEDGNTQVFRLFPGEYNVRNTRALAARIEAHSNLTWGRGVWHEWVGRYTIVKPMGAAIFQVFNPSNQWALQLGMGANGDISLNHRRNQADQIIARNMGGKSFDIKVRDNGNDYEVYLNGVKVGAGSYDRPKNTSGFRWGMYVGATEVTRDGMIFVTGAAVDPKPTSSMSASSKPASSKPASSRPSSKALSSAAKSSIPATGGKCSYLVGSEWNTGFTATIRITNTTARAINGWNVSWAYSDGSKVTSSWNAVLTGSNPYRATNVSWNSTIQPGQYVEFGMQGNKGSNPKAQVPAVTGSACQ